MKRVLTLLFILKLSIIGGQTVSKVWVADNGDGTYKNPIIHADYSDPDAIRVGDDYYMISSSFQSYSRFADTSFKRSRELGTDRSCIKKTDPSGHFDTVQHGCGVWAPAIRYHNNEFIFIILILIWNLFN
jgi:beta-xylosidase